MTLAAYVFLGIGLGMIIYGIITRDRLSNDNSGGSDGIVDGGDSSDGGGDGGGGD